MSSETLELFVAAYATESGAKEALKDFQVAHREGAIDLIDAAVASAAKFTSPLSSLLFFYMHGAAARVPAAKTAFSARQAQWDFDAIGQWVNGAESATHVDWVRSAWTRLEPHLQGHAYINHIAADDQPEKVRASYGANYARLRELKAVFDPTNLFRMNANIPPA